MDTGERVSRVFDYAAAGAEAVAGVALSGAAEAGYGSSGVTADVSPTVAGDLPEFPGVEIIIHGTPNRGDREPASRDEIRARVSNVITVNRTRIEARARLDDRDRRDPSQVTTRIFPSAA